MSQDYKIIYVEKKRPFDVMAKSLFEDFKENLRVKKLEEVRCINRYVVEGASQELFTQGVNNVFSESTVDKVYTEIDFLKDKYYLFAAEFLPGQYDERADAAMQCLAILNEGKTLKVKCAVIIALKGNITEEEIIKIKNYYINPVEKREAKLDNSILEDEYKNPDAINEIQGFINMNALELESFHKNFALAMSFEDLKLCQGYFQNEHRDPTETEIKVIDTYWSDHCRHTTFQASITDVEIEKSMLNKPVMMAYIEYKKSREFVYSNKRDMTLMDIATIAMKELKKQGLLDDLDESEEINACTIKANIRTDEGEEEYLILFKNETHNHPTEIEPYGGAATCLGGAIRDPLSGRAYVYQAMRVTGSGNPNEKIEDTLKGKLPQRKITLGAAEGYSSYGNQIGIATGQVEEVYHEGFKAKRMEIGAVIGAVPSKQVKREKPVKGDVVILLGGRTGRDGCGGATGSSKEHNLDSINKCGAEVQKGNATVERKLQRFFRKEEASKMIKRCNDFGAGGVSVAIGELSEALDINLDLIPKKYEGLNGTELAISESQERMAVVISKEDESKFITLAKEENLEAIRVAEVTDTNRLKMWWQNKLIVDISREFLDTNGAKSYSQVFVKSPSEENNYFDNYKKILGNSFKDSVINTLSELNICSKKGLIERFDSTIGTSTVLMPLGGKYQLTPAEGMAAKIPVLKGDTDSVTLMSYGYNPRIAEWSPYHGALYAVVEAVTKLSVMGGDYKNIKLTLQEYFEKLGSDKAKWGKPFSALLGALYAEKQLGIAAIGGKDSMSGTFENLHVPPTLVAFAVALDNAKNIISPEFKTSISSYSSSLHHTDNIKGKKVYLLRTNIDGDIKTIDFEGLKKNLDKIKELIHKGNIIAAYAIREGGAAAGICKMSFGNKVGIRLNDNLTTEDLFFPYYGSILMQVSDNLDMEEELQGFECIHFGDITPGDEDSNNLRENTNKSEKSYIHYKNEKIEIDELIDVWEKPLSNVFPTKKHSKEESTEINNFSSNSKTYMGIKLPKPRVFIPVFPGTNCEYDSIKAFENQGAEVKSLIFRNLNSSDLKESIKEMARGIKNSQILMIPGGFSAADEPEGSGKFIATVFRNAELSEAVMELIKQKDGLILGICNGFQALIKLGLVPYGEIVDIKEHMPTLTYNSIGRHVSTMVQTKIVSKLSPWFNEMEYGEIHSIPVSHGEGRFTASSEELQRLIKNGQVATQYVDFNGKVAMDSPYNPNGSLYAIEGITSPDGRILGKMAHSERQGKYLYKNIPTIKSQDIFKSGVNYFK